MPQPTGCKEFSWPGEGVSCQRFAGVKRQGGCQGVRLWSCSHACGLFCTRAKKNICMVAQCAQGIASGYPLAGLAARGQLFDKLPPGTLVGALGVWSWLFTSRCRRGKAAGLAGYTNATPMHPMPAFSCPCARAGRHLRRQRGGVRGGQRHH